MDNINLRIKVSKKQFVEWRLRHNWPLVAIFVLIIFVEVAFAAFLGLYISGSNGLSASQRVLTIIALLVAILICAGIQGFLAYYCWKYSLPVMENQLIAIDKAQRILTVESNDGHSRSMKTVLKLRYSKEDREFFEVGENSWKFLYIPKKQLSPEECSFIRSFTPLSIR